LGNSSSEPQVIQETGSYSATLAEELQDAEQIFEADRQVGIPAKRPMPLKSQIAH